MRLVKILGNQNKYRTSHVKLARVRKAKYRQNNAPQLPPINFILISDQPKFLFVVSVADSVAVLARAEA